MNYSPEVTEKIIKEYKNAENKKDIIEVLAERYEKSPKSIIGKLSKEGVYEKNTYKSKNGKTPITRAEIVDQICHQLEGDPGRLQDLAKAPKMPLEYLKELVENST